MKGLFITGIDTAVGKTRVAVAIVTALREAGVQVGAYKPVCSGAVETVSGESQWDDVEQLYTALEGRFSRDQICPQRFSAAVAPPEAARREGRTVNEALLRDGLSAWESVADFLVIEGAGGLLCPLSDRLTMADFAQEAGFPLVVVVANRLGCLNHTLLTLECARNRGLEVAAVILNHPAETAISGGLEDLSLTTNAESLAVAVERYGLPVPLLTLNWNASWIAFGDREFSGRDWYHWRESSLSTGFSISPRSH